MMRGKMIAKSDMQFKGKYLFMDDATVRKIIDRDPSILSLLPQ